MSTFTRGRLVLAVWLALLSLSTAVHVQAQATDIAAIPRDPSELSSSTALSSSSLDTTVNSVGKTPSAGGILAVASPAHSHETGIDWLHLTEDSLSFLAVEHVFRYTTEYGTRDAFHTPFFPGYFDSVANLHGWSDGDPFLVNYVGHPMQGAVAGYIWQHNDRAYRTIEFGKNSRYWKGKMRGAAFSYLYSVQFEIGPLSEASLGHIQAFYPQRGFVDQVITPSVGLGWTLAEDSLDRYIIRPVEAHTRNPYLRILVRGGLNPSRSFANVLSRELPWHRDDRPGVFRPYPEAAAVNSFMEQATAKAPVLPPPGVAPFEFTITPNYRAYVGSDAKGSCVGGGSTAALRVAPQWQIVLDVNGCKLMDLPTNFSGDSLSYMIGPRWTPSTSGRWNTHAQFLVGGTKITQEWVNQDLKAVLLTPSTPPDMRNPLHRVYTQAWDTDGFALSAGTGVDYKINNALAFRVASLEYSHSWIQELNGVNYQNGLQVTTGLVLRMGTW